jgi:hypothetical protein
MLEKSSSMTHQAVAAEAHAMRNGGIKSLIHRLPPSDADKRPDYAGAGHEAVRADRGSRSDSTSFLPPGKARGGR